MVGMKITWCVVLVMCMRVGAVHGFLVNEKPGNGWKYSVNGWEEPQVSRNQVVGERQYQSISFDNFNSKGLATNAKQFLQDTLSDISEQIISQESSSHVDGSYIYNARRTGDHQHTQAALDSSSNFGTNPSSWFPIEHSKYKTHDRSSARFDDDENLDSGKISDSYVINARQPKSFEAETLSLPTENPKNSPPYVYNARKVGPGSLAQDTKTSLSTSNEQPHDEPVRAHEGPISFYTPSSDRDGVFRFVNPGRSVSSALGVNEAAVSQPADKSGCSSSYWAEHIEQWPKILNVYTLVTATFGGENVGRVYGTTTLFQALLDTRNDPYSKLLRHGVAALLNAVTKPSYKTRPNVVIDRFNKALLSRATAAAQAQTFENENHSYGFNECAN